MASLIAKQDCYLLCFGRLGCFLYERKNFGISNACRLLLKICSVKNNFREEGSDKLAHKLSTIILHQLCSTGTQLTNWAGSKAKDVLRLYEKVFFIFEKNLTSSWSSQKNIGLTIERKVYFKLCERNIPLGWQIPCSFEPSNDLSSITLHCAAFLDP